MLVDPDVLHRSRPRADLAELTLRVAPALRYFDGHFPGHPLLPGVVQLGWAIRYSQAEFGLDAPLRRFGPLKFQHPIQPGAEVLLRLEHLAPRSVAFSYASPGRVYSSGRLSFDA